MGRFSVDSELLSPDDFLLPSQTERRWILIWKGGAVTGYYIFLFLNQSQLFQTFTWKSWMICVFKKRFGLCNLNASCMRFSKETSFPKDSQVRSEMPSSHILGCCSGTGQRGTWHLWCNQTHWACLQRTLDQAKLACVTNWWISGNFKFGKYQQSISFGWRRVGLHLVAMMLSSGHPITLLDHANGTKEPKHRV